MDDVWDKIDSMIGHSVVSEKVLNVKKTNKINTKFNIHITRGGTFIYIDEIDNILKKIKAYFTIKDKTMMGYIKNTTNYECKNNKIYIPRFGSFILKNKFSNIIHHNSIIAKNPLSNLNYNGKFNGNQELIFNEIVKNYYNTEKTTIGKSGLILNLQAGMGKTYLAMSLIAYLKCRTLIVVHNTGMLQQWEKVLNAQFPNASIGLYYGKKKTHGDIVIGVINSLVQDSILGFNTYQEFYELFDVVIFDEAHEYCSPTRKKIYCRCQAPYMIGLSATPNDREDNLDKINHWGIGPVLDASKLNGYTEANIPFKGHVIQVKYSGPECYTRLLTNEKLEIMSAPLMIEQLTQDEFRLKMIVDLTLEHHRENHNIFIFADRRLFLSKIEEQLNITSAKNNQIVECKYLTNDKEARVLESIRLVGGSSSEEMELAKDKKTIILSTYAYMATGTSIPKMNCLILATPRKSKSRQIVGRIFRLGSDYSITRKIIDIVDVKTGMKNQWYQRKKYYDEQGYTMEIRKLSYFDIHL